MAVILSFAHPISELMWGNSVRVRSEMLYSTLGGTSA